MKNVFKLLTLPIALTCCSMAPNAPSIQFVAFGIEDDDPVAHTFRPCAYLDINIRNLDKVCNYSYQWIDGDNVAHDCGSNAIHGLTIHKGYPLNGCDDLDVDYLNLHSPVTFVCKAKIAGSGETTYTITLPYNGKINESITISESTNNQELSTGYLKEAHYPNSSLDYRYCDVITSLNFEDLYVNELYYDLDISHLRFKYRNGLDNALKGKFTFAFYDRYGLFPDFEISEESLYRYIPLTVNQEEGEEEFYLTFTPTMYYDPETHDCSLIKKENYVPTNHLMLPFKSAAELKFLPCYIELEIQGHMKFTVTGKFMVTYLKKYFGDCEDSEFCYEVHQNDEVNIREKVVEVII